MPPFALIALAPQGAEPKPDSADASVLQGNAGSDGFQRGAVPGDHPRSGTWTFAKDGKRWLAKPRAKDLRK